MSFLKSFQISDGTSSAEFVAQTANDVLMPKANPSDPDVSIAGAISDVSDALSRMSGVTTAYVRQEGVLFMASWLSAEVDGEALVPATNGVYMILTEGDYYRQLVTWDGSNYRLVGNVNTATTEKAIPTRTQTYSVQAYASQSGGGSAKTDRKVVFTATKDTYSITITTSAKDSMGTGSAVQVEFGGQVVLSGWSGSKTINLTPADAGKQVIVQAYCASAGTQTWARVTATVNAQFAFLDYETDNYVPNTAEAPGQAGLVPAAPAGTEAKVLTSDGWDETPLNITTQEIQEIFGMTTPEQINYSADEKIVGTWIDGKTLYQKTITLGALPKAGQKTVPHGIADLEFVVKISGSSAGIDGGVMCFIPIPQVTHIEAYNINIYITDTAVVIHTGSYDRSVYTESYVTLTYTKTK